MRRSGLVGTLVFCLLPSNPLSIARAGLVTFQVEGVVTEIQDPYQELGELVQLGDHLVASYTFEGTTPDSRPLDPTLGWYDDAVQSITGTVGLIPFGSQDPFGQISIGNNSDYYSVAAEGLLTPLDEPGDKPARFFLDLADPTGTGFTSDALPLAPPPLAAFDSRLFYLTIGSDRIVLTGQVTGIVPEPASLVLVGIGAAAMLLRRSHRRRRACIGAIAALLFAVPELSLMAQQWMGGPVLIGGDDAEEQLPSGCKLSDRQDLHAAGLQLPRQQYSER